MSIKYASNNNIESKTLDTSSIWARPSDWLTLTPVGSTEQKFSGLYAIFPDNYKNYVAVLVQGNYTVDWGDGTTSNHSSNTVATHNYDYATISNSTLTTSGYKQVIITITPQAGQNLSVVNIRQRPVGTTGSVRTNWLDIELGSPNLTSAIIGANNSVASLPYLKRFRLASKATSYTNFTDFFYWLIELEQIIIDADMSNVTTIPSMFYSCKALKYPPLFNTSNVTDASNMFQLCCNLLSVPAYNLSNNTSMSNMFNGCSKLKEINIINTDKVTSTWQSFTNCSDLISINTLDCSNVTNALAMFSGCNSIDNIKLINTDKIVNGSNLFLSCSTLKNITFTMSTAGNLSNTTNMFNGCNSLENAPTFGTSKVVFMTNMFNACSSLITVPTYDTSNVTNIQSMFGSCFSLNSIPPFNTSNCTIFTNFASGCNALAEAPLLDTSKATAVSSMFGTCVGLTYLPAYNLANVVSGGGAIIGNPTGALAAGSALPIAKADIYGLKYSINFTFSSLSKDEIQNIFQNLGIAAASQTITITNNYGADTAITSNLTAGQASGSTTLTVASSASYTIGQYVTNAVCFADTAVTFQDAGDVVVKSSHGLSDGTRVSFPTITTTTGITAYQIYYVINATTNTFRISDTMGGSAVTLTNNGSGTMRYEVYITAKPSSTQVTLSAPTTAITTATALSARTLNTYLATLKNWIISG